MVLSTSGGLVGSDRFDVAASADSYLILTTQAVERAYRQPHLERLPRRQDTARIVANSHDGNQETATRMVETPQN
ncbi:urease accessory protein UreD [Roseobacter sp. EG26]|uniref:urease accessory protein UreD n=1 Tax=Roseobacter sp. EG26 TaxID=3412477 RepID=UPI003CE4E601